MSMELRLKAVTEQIAKQMESRAREFGDQMEAQLLALDDMQDISMESRIKMKYFCQMAVQIVSRLIEFADEMAVQMLVANFLWRTGSLFSISF